jgi:hypothetical protein
MSVQNRDLDSNLRYVFLQSTFAANDPAVATTQLTQGANWGIGFVPAPGTIKAVRVIANGITNGPLVQLFVNRGQSQATLSIATTLSVGNVGLSLIPIGSTALNVYTNDFILASITNSGGGTCLLQNLGFNIAIQLTQDIVSNFAT